MLAFSRWALLTVLLLIGGLNHGWSQIPTGSDITGNYRRIGPAMVVLKVSAGNGGVQVQLAGGGAPSTDGSVPADCTVRAAGHLNDRLLSAVFQPFETEDFSYSAAQARSENRHLVIAFKPGMAEVKRADTDGYCGLGIQYQGLYRKTH